MYTPIEKNKISRVLNIINMIKCYLPEKFADLPPEDQKNEWEKASAKYVADKIQTCKDRQFTHEWELVIKTENGHLLNFPPDFPTNKRKIYEETFKEAKSLFNE